MPENLYTGDDSTVARDNIVEKDRLVWTRMVLKRFTSFTQPSGTSQEAGQAPARNFFAIEISAGVKLLTGKDILTNGGIYVLGDIQLETKIAVWDANNKANPPTQADQILWDSVTYTMVGKPWSIRAFGGRVKFMSVWRRSN